MIDFKDEMKRVDAEILAENNGSPGYSEDDYCVTTQTIEDAKNRLMATDWLRMLESKDELWSEELDALLDLMVTYEDHYYPEAIFLKIRAGILLNRS